MSRPRLTIFYQNMPIPANQGGKADVLRRIQALRACGVEVQLVHWIPGGSSAVPGADLESLREAVDGLISLPRLGCRPAWRNIASVPLWLTKFRLDSTNLASLAASIGKFGSSAIWVEGPWTAEAGADLARRLRIPLLYRSHNIEHAYMAGQARATRSALARWRMRASFLHLERFERAAMLASLRVYDISNDDLEWWRSRGIRHNQWLPPVSEAALRAVRADIERDLDVLFLGNLVSPNNLMGVDWLLREVWPLVRTGRPGTTLTIAGSAPPDWLRRKIESTPGASLFADVPDALEMLRRTKVHANPVMTGSGIQLKTMEMLMTDAPVVSTPQGVAGFPGWLKDEIHPVSDPAGFAARIIDHLRSPQVVSQPRIRAQGLFSVSALEGVVDDLSKISSGAVLP